MPANTAWTFADLLERAWTVGATKIHLRPGAPPLYRMPESELCPFDESWPEVQSDHLMRELSLLVEPEDWPRLEQEGGGDVTARAGPGVAVRITLFRGSGQWSVVAHL